MFHFGPKIPQITVDEVKKILEEKEDAVLLDVRSQNEYKSGKIMKSINVPVDEVSENIEKLIPDKNRLIYVYCLSGSRSAHAANTMIKLGYKNVFNMTSGLLAWRAKHYPLSS